MFRSLGFRVDGLGFIVVDLRFRVDVLSLNLGFRV